jgi:lipid-A-disaccharide synthase
MKLFVLAGEPSGDKLGAALMAGLKTLQPDVVFSGVGGPGMIAAGLQSQFDMSELSVMGIAEVLPKYFHLNRRIRETADAVIAMNPEAMITIDSPDFNLRVAKLVKEARPDLRCVHYVAPTVWAWRPHRAEKMAQWIDHVLALFPFEPPYMEAAGMRCDFVGHPVVGEEIAQDAEADAFRAAHGINTEAPVVLTLPGSRNGEVTRLTPVFGDTLARLADHHPDLRVVVPTVPHLHARVQELVADWPGDPIVLDPALSNEKRAAFRAADVALAASGTVSLELAASQTPMVIAYDMNWLSRMIVQRKLLIDTVTLVNLVSETRAVPEFIYQRCKPELIAPALRETLADPEAQFGAMADTMKKLGQGGEPPGLRAARAVLEGIAQA